MQSSKYYKFKSIRLLKEIVRLYTKKINCAKLVISVIIKRHNKIIYQ